MQPRNYLLFACHLTNTAAQLVQEARFTNYWHFGGREKKFGSIAPDAKSKVLAAVEEAEKKSEDAAKKVVGK